MPTGNRGETLSPELVLVDEQLDRSARLQLREPPAPLTADPPRSHRRLPKRPVPTLTVWGGLLIALAVAVSALLLAGNDGTPGTNNAGDGTTARQSQATAKGLELRWKIVPGASLYNVILWKDGVRKLDLWPTSASVRVPTKRLESGSYHWFVYPMLGDGSARRYGRVIARGVVQV